MGFWGFGVLGFWGMSTDQQDSIGQLKLNLIIKDRLV